MAIRTSSSPLWTLVQERQQIDPHQLFDAVLSEAQQPAPDYRTRLLIHESLEALANLWATAGAALLAQPALRPIAERNWRIMYGDELL